jgi:predicted PP-loop superfamily ATPase
MTSQQEDTRNLAQRYAQMSDEELQLISSQQSDLTEAAQNALRVELTRRGMAQALAGQAGPPGRDEVEFKDLVTVRRFAELTEALVAKGSLESAGIECYLVDDNMVRIFVPTFTEGVRLQVRPEDLAAATEILNEPAPENFEDEEASTSE